MVLKCFLSLAFTNIFLTSKIAFAAQEVDNTKYLEYKNTAVTGATSVTSTFFYILSLILVFALVLFLAYFVSRFIGSKFGSSRFLSSSNILSVMPIEQNKKIIFVEINNSILVLGITENNISLLKEISASEDIKNLKEDLLNNKMTDGFLNYQTNTLENIQKKIKPMLRNLPIGKKEDLK